MMSCWRFPLLLGGRDERKVWTRCDIGIRRGWADSAGWGCDLGVRAGRGCSGGVGGFGVVAARRGRLTWGGGGG